MAERVWDWAIFLAFLGFLLAAVHFMWGCGSSLVWKEEDSAEILDTAAKIAKCQAEGRACKAAGGTYCYAVYEECMRREGLEP